MSQYPDSLICSRCKLLPAINENCLECKRLLNAFIKITRIEARWNDSQERLDK